MSKPLTASGEIVDVHPLHLTGETHHQLTLVDTDDVEIIQIVIPAGKSVPMHEAEGVVILHCLEGRLSVAVHDERRELRIGQLLYVDANERFSMETTEDTSVLATIITPKQGPMVELIGGHKPK